MPRLDSCLLRVQIICFFQVPFLKEYFTILLQKGKFQIRWQLSKFPGFKAVLSRRELTSFSTCHPWCHGGTYHFASSSFRNVGDYGVNNCYCISDNHNGMFSIAVCQLVLGDPDHELRTPLLPQIFLGKSWNCQFKFEGQWVIFYFTISS